MGSGCSLNRCRKGGNPVISDTTVNEKVSASNHKSMTCRHSFDVELPNESIASLYPIEDNYVIDEGGKTRSPKSLVQLCIDCICRNMADFDQDIPSGLPRELVDEILRSLVNHSALNTSTLRALRRCELTELPLHRSRGVSDEWLSILSVNDVSYHGTKKALDISEEIDSSGSSSSSVTSFHSAFSSPGNYHSQNNPIPLQTECSLSVKIASSLNAPVEHFLPATAQTAVLDLRGSQKLTDKGLLHLKHLSALEIVRLDNCYSITGRGLLAFSNSRSIHTLTMSDCRCLTDEAIINVGHLTSITTLVLDGCRCLTDVSLRAIGNLVNLSRLDLSQCDLISDDAISYLYHLDNLQDLSLGWCRRITDMGIEMLVQQPRRSENMRALCLARCQIRDIGIGHIARLKALESLNLNGCSEINSLTLGETLKCLTHLESLDVSFCPGILKSCWQGKIDRLKSLDLCYSFVKDVHLSRFISLPQMEEINFDSCPVGDWSLAHLADNNVVPNLTSLNLADCDITDTGMSHIPKFNKLRHLSLFYCNISNSGLRHLASMATLESLNLDSRDISDEGLYHLRGLNLKCLDIFSGRISDIGCVHIGKIKSLECLDLCGGSIGDLGCAYIAENLQNLSSLNLAQNELITNKGAAPLAGLKKLKALNLSHTSVSIGVLRYFKDLRQLQSLALYGCQGVRDSKRFTSLQRELPNLKCLRVDGSLENEGRVENASDSVEESASYYTSDEEEEDENNEMSYEHFDNEEMSFDIDDPYETD